MNFSNLKLNKINLLPKTAGVYAFKKGKEILYIGKAANLRERVKNHFPSRSEGERRMNVLRTQQPAFRDNLFINQVTKIGYIKTDSEIEALILEANLIKKYQPKYNVVWRDDKNYFFVAKTKEDFPRIFLTHQPKLEIRNWKLEINYVGPFVDGRALKETLKTLRKVFPYRSCRVLPKRACLWYQLGKCPAPCLVKLCSTFKVEQSLRNRVKSECQGNVKNLMKILRGKKRQTLNDLKKEMAEAAEIQDFEKAAKIRDQIEALERILAHTRIIEELIVPQTSLWYYKKVEEKLKSLLKTKGEISRIEAYDVSNIQGQEATGSMVTFINGLPDKNFYRKFKIKISGKPDDIAMIKEILSRRFKHPEWGFPDLVLIDGGKAQLNAATKCSTLKFEHIKVMALAKKENKLYVEKQKEPIFLKTLPREVFNLILQLRDEAHRFAISYHKKLREIDTFD